MAKTSRYIMRIELSNPAKTKLAAASDKHGMTQVALMSRLVEWYSGQEQMVQGTVMGHYPAEIAKDVNKLILKRLAK